MEEEEEEENQRLCKFSTSSFEFAFAPIPKVMALYLGTICFLSIYHHNVALLSCHHYLTLAAGFFVEGKAVSG